MNVRVALDPTPQVVGRPAAPDSPEAFPRAVSLRRILRHDNPSFLMVSFGAVIFAFALFTLLTGRTIGGRGRPSRPVSPQSAREFLGFASVLLAALSGLEGLRAWRIRRLFRMGVAVVATVVAVSSAKGRSLLKLEFHHGGALVSVRRSIRRSARAGVLKEGDALPVLVDPVRPRRMVLAGLYD